jgi:RND family efflux transporter MFP subunit
MKPISVLLPFLLAIVGCSRHEPTAPIGGNLPAVPVRLAPVQAGYVPQFIEIAGTVRPVRRAVLAARVMGAITDLPITLGQRVEAGAILVKINAADTEARLAQARAGLSVSRRDLERERSLLAKAASTAETVRNLEDRLTGAEAAVREAEANLGYAEIRAPFAGVIARRLVNAGDLAAPGQPLLELEESTNFEIDAFIPASLAVGLTPGSALSVDADSRRLSGVLKEISSTADSATRSIGVKISVPAGAAVRSGQFVRVQIPGPTVRTLLIPSSALSLSGQMERVFVAGEGNRAILRLVKTGAARGDQLEVLSGLTAGEHVVVAPPANLRDGQPLEVQP